MERNKETNLIQLEQYECLQVRPFIAMRMSLQRSRQDKIPSEACLRDVGHDSQ